MNGNLTGSVVKGVYWQTIGRYSALIVQFVVTVILARLVEPSEYGVIGILTVFIAISNIFLEAGLGQSLIQKGAPNSTDYASVYFFNIVIGVSIYFILFFFLPLIARFYSIPNLVEYGRALFVVIPLSSLCVVQTTILTIKFEYKKLAFIQIISAIVSGIVGVLFAYRGYGVYALVFHAIALNLSNAILLSFMSGWRPSLIFSWSAIKALLPFGISLLLTSLIKTIFNNIYTLIIGKSYTSEDVAYYNQAQRLEELSGYTILSVLISVSFPAFVQLRDDLDKLKKAYKRLFTSSIFMMIPIFSIILLSSTEIITIVFSEKWLPAVPYLKLLCIYGMTLPLHLVNENVLKVFGEGKTILVVEIVRRSCIIIALFFTVKISVSAMIIGQILSMLPVIIISMVVSGKYISYSLFEQFKDVLPYYIIGFVLGFVCYYVTRNMYVNVFIGLIIKAFLFGVPYVLLCFVFHLVDFNYIKHLLIKKQ